MQLPPGTILILTMLYLQNLNWVQFPEFTFLLSVFSAYLRTANHLLSDKGANHEAICCSSFSASMIPFFCDYIHPNLKHIYERKQEGKAYCR